MGFVGWERTLWIGGWLGRLGDLVIRAMFTKAPSPLSLSQPPAPSPSRPLAKLDAPRISLRSGVTNLFLCNRLSLIFLTFMFTYVHILYSPHPTGWKGFHFLWNFLVFTRKTLFMIFSHSESLSSFTCLSSGPKVDVYWFYNMGNSERWTIFDINFICLGVCSKVIISWLWVMLWVRCSRKDQICS